MKRIAIQSVIMLLMLSMVIALFPVCSYAAPVTGSYYNTDPQYTSITNTYGYSMGNFTGNYYYSNSPNNNAIIHGEARGGVVSSFYTELFLFLWDAVNVSDREYRDTSSGTRLLEATINECSGNIIGGANGYVEASSYSLSDSSDMWQYNYLYFWTNAQAGWN